MTTTEIITNFELYMDDSTELSSTEELALLNRVYHFVCSIKPWEFLKKSHTDTTSTSVPYISLPSDFSYLISNANYTDSSFEASRPVVFVGDTYSPYQVVSWSDRRQYRDQDGYCYVDIVNSRLYFTKQPATAQSVEFDYMSVPIDLSSGDTPLIPERFTPVLWHLMAVDDNIIQMSDKAKSYAQENNSKAKAYLDNLSYWNANLIQQ